MNRVNVSTTALTIKRRKDRLPTEFQGGDELMLNGLEHVVVGEPRVTVTYEDKDETPAVVEVQLRLKRSGEVITRAFDAQTSFMVTRESL